MYDRPDARDLLEAAWLHLEKHVVPLVSNDRKVYVQTLAAINLLTMAGYL